MKKIVLFIALLLPLMAAAQGVEGKRPVYCEVMGVFNALGKMRVQIDIGEHSYSKGFDNFYETDGKKKKFKSMVEVLNFMGEKGWRVVDTYNMMYSYKSQIVHYLMEKWISDDSQIKEGLILKEDKEPIVSLINEDSYYVPTKKDKEDE